jgi:hypothetical protein
MNQGETERIVLEVENKTGWVFMPEEVQEILAYTIRKAVLNNKSEEYIPILFENELRDAVMRDYINLMGRKNLCAKSAI